MGLASMPVVTSLAVGGGSLVVTEKEFIEKGKFLHIYIYSIVFFLHDVEKLLLHRYYNSCFLLLCTFL